MRTILRAVVLVLVHLVLSSVAGPAHARPDDPVGVWPLDPRPDVVRHFEPPPGPYAAGHRGVDLAGSPGQAVRASLAGTVGFAGSIGGKPVVTVLHGGRRTTYEPVVASVERDQVVAAGDVLGRLVVTDSHCFPAACLHWGLIEGGGDARLPRPALARRRRSGAAAAVVARRPGHRPAPVEPTARDLATRGRLARLSTPTSRPLRSSASLRRRPLRHTNTHRFVRLRMTLARAEGVRQTDPHRYLRLRDDARAAEGVRHTDPHRYLRLRMTLARAEGVRHTDPHRYLRLRMTLAREVGGAQARGWACWYARRNRSVVTWV